MRFRVLGPLEVRDEDGWTNLTAAKQRALLAVLLLKANQAVSAHWLIEQLWDQQPPATAANQLQVHVSRLRRLLGDPRGRILVTQAPGYRLAVGPGELDLDWFEELAASGRGALGDGALDQAAGMLGEALRLWRGPALADVPAGALVEREAARLEERRLLAVEDCVEVKLRRARHGELVAELQVLVAQEPLRERRWGLLLLALYRSGRQADALAAYRQLRERLVEELGVEPGAELQRLQRQILAADPALEAPAAVPRTPTSGLVGTAVPRPVPRQLPAGVATFTGREQELAWLEETLGAPEAAGSVAIAVLHGAGGIGKSTLAVHAAHRLAARYPDGQLYVNLQGSSAGLAPLEPMEALGRFLRALGADGLDGPVDVAEAAARFRSQVAGRRLLVVLDDARGVEQVRPLLPGSPGCGVLVTSRQVLPGLEGARTLLLDVLPHEQALALLGRVVGEGRTAAEPRAATAVVHWCGRLPLAIQIAGARLAARPGWSVEAMADRLADEQRRLDELEVAELGVRASFRVSHQELERSAKPQERAAAAAFELLGVLDGADVSLPVAARLLDRPEQAAERALERLVDVQLLEAVAPGRYRLHDLMRLFAREQAARHDHDRKAAALRRVLRLYVATAWHAFALLRPGHPRLAWADPRSTEGGLEFAGAVAASAWLEAERPNLVATVDQAASTPGVPAGAVVQLAHALMGFFEVRHHWRDGVQVNQAALRVAERAEDRPAQAHVHCDLGSLLGRLGRFEAAVAHHRTSQAICHELGDRNGQATSQNGLGIVFLVQDRLLEALASLRQSHTLFALAGHRSGQAASLNNLANVYERKGWYVEALTALYEGRDLFVRAGDRIGEAICLDTLGVVERRLGRYQEAIAALHESFTAFGELGDRVGQAEALRNLGDTLEALGDTGQARKAWQEALTICEALPTSEADGIRRWLAIPT